jgi:hypothetical protein
MRLARVPPGIASQSISPKGAATRPDTTPAAIIQYDSSDQKPFAVMNWTTSNINAVASRPRGNTINI